MAYRMEDLYNDFPQYRYGNGGNAYTFNPMYFPKWTGMADEEAGPHLHYTQDPYVKFNADLPDDYIDAGIVLTKGFTISRQEFEDMSLEEWKQVQDWVESMSNITVDEINPDDDRNRILWVYDMVPCITTVPA